MRRRLARRALDKRWRGPCQDDPQDPCRRCCASAGETARGAGTLSRRSSHAGMALRPLPLRTKATYANCCPCSRIGKASQGRSLKPSPAAACGGRGTRTVKTSSARVAGPQRQVLPFLCVAEAGLPTASGGVSDHRCITSVASEESKNMAGTTTEPWRNPQSSIVALFTSDRAAALDLMTAVIVLFDFAPQGCANCFAASIETTHAGSNDPANSRSV